MKRPQIDDRRRSVAQKWLLTVPFLSLGLLVVAPQLQIVKSLNLKSLPGSGPEQLPSSKSVEALASSKQSGSNKGSLFLHSLQTSKRHSASVLPRLQSRNQHKMTIPAKVYSGNAGTSDVANKTWTNSASDGGGYPYYVADPAATNKIRWNPNINCWTFENFRTDVATANYNKSLVVYYSSGGQTLASGPVGTYTAGGQGAAPVPTVTLGGTSITDPTIAPSGRILKPHSQMW